MEIFLSYCTHTHPLGGLDVPFEVYERSSNQMADHLSLSTWLCLISFIIAHTHPSGCVDVPLRFKKYDLLRRGVVCKI